MKINFGVVVILCVVLFSCDSTDKKTEEVSYQLTKKELLIKEQKNPADFLNITGSDKRNLLGQTVVKGKITNKATVAIFKDVDVELSFFSKTKALLEKDTETIFEQLKPGEVKDFKTKYFAPKGTDSVALKILKAKIVAVEM
ncbi:MAG: hypothetical protein ABIO77_05765 [Ginsengibacter sp.]